MSKHTPGPWLVKSDPIRFDTLSTVVGGVKKKAKGIERQMIVQVGGWAEWREQEANARLIAAAPDLLEALKALTNSLDEHDLLHDDQRLAFGDSLAAIAKATGEKQ